MTRGQLVLLEILWGLSWVFPPAQKTLPLLFPTLQKEPPCCSTLSTWMSMEWDTWKNSVGVFPPWVRAQPGKAPVLLYL